MAAVRAEEPMGRSCRLRIDVSARKPTLSNMGRATGLPFARNTRLCIDVSARKSALSNMDRATGLPFTRKGSHDMAAVCAEEFALRNRRSRKIGHAADRTGGEPVM